MSYRPLAHLSAGALDGVGTSEGGRRKLWGLGRVDVVLVTKCIASFFGEAATLASSTYALRLVKFTKSDKYLYASQSHTLSG